MEAAEFCKTLIPSMYVTVTKCYCVVPRHLSRSEYCLTYTACCVLTLNAHVVKILSVRLMPDKVERINIQPRARTGNILPRSVSFYCVTRAYS
jgi:hypothetical protein